MSSPFIYTWFYFNTVFIQNIIVFLFFKHSKLIESSPILNLVQSYRTIFPQTILVFYHPSCTSFLSQFSSLPIIYFILGVRSGSLTFLVPMSANCRYTSHQSIFCILHFLHSLQNTFSLKCVWYVWYPCHSQPCTQHIYYPRQSKYIPLELCMYPCSTIHESTF